MKLERIKMKENNLTRDGIAKDLSKSPYTFTYVHNGKTVNFNFSSKLHLEKFIKNRDKNYTMIYNSIYKRFKFKTDCKFLSDFNLYYKIEKRGCYIKFGDRVYKNLINISLN